ncbi:MAG TPA: ATP-binding protein [Streptosporangiaceae bacterium]
MTVSAGGCSASPLPLDATCAAAARRLFRATAAGVGLPDESVYDGVIMASELAANSMHAQTGIQFDVRGCAVAGAPEMWLYLRRVGGEQELVCKVFDALPRWKDDTRPDPAVAVPVDAVSGRGLHVIEGLSHGRWGHHLTRARLGGWKVPGKAVWFAVPVPASSALDRFRRPQPGSVEAAGILERMLSERGIGHIVRADAPVSGMSVLSIRRGLTVWCRSRVVSWTGRSGHREWRAFSDLVDAAEQIIGAHEELASADTAAGGQGR